MWKTHGDVCLCIAPGHPFTPGSESMENRADGAELLDHIVKEVGCVIGDIGWKVRVNKEMIKSTCIALCRKERKVG